MNVWGKKEREYEKDIYTNIKAEIFEVIAESMLPVSESVTCSVLLYLINPIKMVTIFGRQWVDEIYAH